MGILVFSPKAGLRNVKYAIEVNRVKKQKKKDFKEKFWGYVDNINKWLDGHHTCRKAIKYCVVTTSLALITVYSTNPTNLWNMETWIVAVGTPVVLLITNYLKHNEVNINTIFKR